MTRQTGDVQLTYSREPGAAKPPVGGDLYLLQSDDGLIHISGLTYGQVLQVMDAVAYAEHHGGAKVRNAIREALGFRKEN